MGKGEENLLEAAKSQDLSTVQKLIHKGKGKILGSSKKVNVNHQDGDGFSSLHYAALYGNADIACLLIDANATLDIQDNNGMRPLHYCAWKGKFELVALLLDSGSKCNVQAQNGYSPLHLSAQYGHIPICRILLQYGADPSLRASNGTTSLDLACEFGRHEVVEMFLSSSGCSSLLDYYRAQSHDGDHVSANSPLHLSVRNGHIKVIKSLLHAGMDINWKSSSGSCLHEAVSNENLEVVQLLIDCGINTSIRSGLGLTALDVAKKLHKSSTAVEIARKLSYAQPGLLQVYAINDFKNVYDNSSLAFTKGSLISVLEQNPNGIWKGRIDDFQTRASCIGYFPASYVQVPRHHGNTSMAGSDDSGIHPHDDDVTHLHPSSGYPPHYQQQQWPHPSIAAPVKPLQITPKYINVDPHNNSNQPLISKVQLVGPNVVNPSYDDVICSHPSSKSSTLTPTTPISRGTPEVSINRPSISNPGYEDVLLDHISATNRTNTASSSGSKHSHHVTATSEAATQHRVTPVSTNRKGSGSVTSAAPVQSTSSAEQLHQWLHSFGMDQYVNNFLYHGYDLHTVSCTDPSDLIAIGIHQPAHRNMISTHVDALKKKSPPSPMINKLPHSVNNWLVNINLQEYSATFEKHRINSVEKLIELSSEGLQRMGIEKLGHQKKLIVAINKLLQQTYSKINKNTEQVEVRSSHHNYAGRSQPPKMMTNPNGIPLNPSLLTKKPLVQTKPRKGISSGQETPTVSSELQQALSRRQKIIDEKKEDSLQHVPQHNGDSRKIQQHNDDSRRIPSIGSNIPNKQNHGKIEPIHIPVHGNIQDPPLPSPQHIAANQQFLADMRAQRSPLIHSTNPPVREFSQKVQRSSSHRGPRPSPPKRTTSICTDESPQLSPQLEPIIDETEAGSKARLNATNMDPTRTGRRKSHECEGSQQAQSTQSTSGSVFSFSPKAVKLESSQHVNATSSQHASATPSQHVSATSSQHASATSSQHVNATSSHYTGVAASFNSAKELKPAFAARLEAQRKPPVTPKPKSIVSSQSKPVVMKKPQFVRQSRPQVSAERRPSNEVTTNVAMTTTSKKPPQSEHSKRFDLSVLDHIEKTEMKMIPTSSSQTRDNGADAPPHQSSNLKLGNVEKNPKVEAAVKKVGVTMPPLFSNNHEILKKDVLTSSESNIKLVSKVDKPDPLDDFDWPAPPPDLPSPGDVTNILPSTSKGSLPKSSDIRSCFEEDEDTGTVKRRPPSIVQKDESDANFPSLLGGSDRGGLVENTRTQDVPSTKHLPPKLPPKTSSKDLVDTKNDVSRKQNPPPIPQKLSMKAAPMKETSSETFASTDEEESMKTQKMLDDIGSMFDDLVNEFDDILN